MTARFVSWALWTAFALPACGRADAIGTKGLAITGGGPEAGYPAVFALAYDGTGGCTGTCVAPRVGLTAAHCVEGESPKDLTALFGDTELEPNTILRVTDLATEPAGGDIALVSFTEDCPAVVPPNRTALESHIDEPVLMVGFGVTAEEASDFGIKRSGTATLSSVDPAEVNGLEPGELATSNDPGGTCYGDSGGPTFMTFEGIEYTVGVTSRGSNDAEGWPEPCGRGLSIAVRADSYSVFIDEFIAAHEEADAGTDPVPDAGAEDAGDPADARELGDPDAGPSAGEPEAEPTHRPRAAAGCSVARSAQGRWSALVWLAALAVRRRRLVHRRRLRAPRLADGVAHE